MRRQTEEGRQNGAHIVNSRSRRRERTQNLLPLADPRLRLASQHIIARHYTTVMGCAMHASIWSTVFKFGPLHGVISNWGFPNINPSWTHCCRCEPNLALNTSQLHCMRGALESPGKCSQIWNLFNMRQEIALFNKKNSLWYSDIPNCVPDTNFFKIIILYSL